MNGETLMDPEFSGRLCAVLLHSLWQVPLFALIAWSLERLWRRRSVEVSCGLHVAALVASLAALPMTYGVVKVAGAAAVAQSEKAVEAGSPVSVHDVDELNESLPVDGEIDPSANSGGYSTAPGIVASTPFAPSGEELTTFWLRIAPWIVALYTVGVLFMLARLIASTWRAQRLCSRAQLIADGELMETLKSLTHNWSMRMVPALARAEQIVVPKVAGLLRPTILLPASAITGLSPDQLEMILAHELAHVRRYDMWVNFLQRIAEAALFFNPTLWYLSRRISTLREYCCDELTCRAMSKSDAEPRTRYALALLRVVELEGRALPNQGSHPVFAGGDAAALAASGRSPSELRRRVAHLFGEPLREPLRISRGGILTIAGFVLLTLVGPPLWPTGELTVEQVDASVVANDVEAVESKEEDRAASAGGHADRQVDLSFGAKTPAAEEPAAKVASEEEANLRMVVIRARHVLLLEGKEIITWPEIEAKIAALPDPTLARPSLYVTRGAREAGVDKFASSEIRRIKREYSFYGYTWGSLSPRTDLRYDRIEQPSDLEPDESLRMDGKVMDGNDEPVDGAEVILITPIDESIPYKSYHMELFKGRVYKPVDHVMTVTDEQGRFSLHPPKNVNYHVVVMHRDAGFTLIGDRGLATGDDITLRPWAGLVSEVDNEPNLKQKLTLGTRVAASADRPEVVFNQSFGELKREEPTLVYEFTHVPHAFETSVYRLFPYEQGVSHSIPGASVGLLPGETRRLGLGALTEQQHDHLESLRQYTQQRLDAFKKDGK